MNSVLVVDDHSLLTQGLTYALRAEGYDVVPCAEPDEQMVVALALVHRPALALLDLQFSDGAHEGLALIGPLSATTPVLVLTGVTDAAILGECLDAGAVGVASKADPFDQLLERIQTALRGEPVNSLREREDLLNALRDRRNEDARRFAEFDALSPREREVLEHLASGIPAEAIAERIFISVPTVRTHIQAILRKLDVTSQLAAVARVREAGWSLEASAS